MNRELIMKIYTIGQLAKQASVNIQTIRFYERKGILMPIERLESGYRIYDDECFRQLKFILQAKEFGFSLQEIGELLDLSVPSSQNCDAVKEKIHVKLADVRNKIAQLKQLESTLKSLAQDCENRPEPDECPIIQSINT